MGDSGLSGLLLDDNLNLGTIWVNFDDSGPLGRVVVVNGKATSKNYQQIKREKSRRLLLMVKQVVLPSLMKLSLYQKEKMVFYIS